MAFTPIRAADGSVTGPGETAPAGVNARCSADGAHNRYSFLAWACRPSAGSAVLKRVQAGQPGAGPPALRTAHVLVGTPISTSLYWREDHPRWRWVQRQGHNHQNVAALLTLGEILVEKIIPIGSPDIESTEEAEKLRNAFETYPFFLFERDSAS